MFDDETTGVSSDATDPDVEGDAPGGEQPATEVDLDKLPLHLHARGKELVAEKNVLKDKVRGYESLGAPADLARKLARLEVLEEVVAAEREEPVTKAPATEEERDTKQKRAWAREQLLDLVPEINQLLKDAKEGKDTRVLVDAYKNAIEEEAWDTTVELADAMGMDPETLARKTIAVIGDDRKLLRLFNSGKSEIAVKAAVKILQEGIGTKGGDLTKRADAIKRGKEDTSKLPATHKPGGTVEPTKVPEGPKTWADAAKRTAARLEKAG